MGKPSPSRRGDGLLGGDATPAPGHPHPELGRGLLLLDRLAEDRGVTEHDQTPTCKTVWFDVTKETGHHEGAHLDLCAGFDIDTVDALYGQRVSDP